MSVNYRFLPIFTVPNKFQEKYMKISVTEASKRPKGSQRGATPLPGGHPVRPGVGPRHLAAWAPGGAPLALLRGSGSFRTADFCSDFSGIFGALLIGVKSLQLKDISRQKLALGALS